MKSPVSDEEREEPPRDHLSLASANIQCSLPVSDTPLLVEELLEDNLSSADQYLRELARPHIFWYC